MLNVRPDDAISTLKIRDSKASGWFTKMTKQTAEDPVDDRPRSTILALRMSGPHLKTFQVEPIAAGKSHAGDGHTAAENAQEEDDRQLMHERRESNPRLGPRPSCGSETFRTGPIADPFRHQTDRHDPSC